MKKIYFLLCMLSVGFLPTVFGNQLINISVQEKPIDKKDCIMNIKGEMFVIKGGKKTEMLKAIIMTNGTKVLANGMIYLKDGTELKLEDGDCVYMNGKIERKETA